MSDYPDIKPASPLPWRKSANAAEVRTGANGRPGQVVCKLYGQRHENADFIAAACNAYPDLRAKNERLRDELGHVRTLYEREVKLRKIAQERAERAEELAVARVREADVARQAERIAELEREVERLSADCDTCGGDGIMDVVVAYLPPDGREELAAEPCAECEGTGRALIGQLRATIARVEAAIRKHDDRIGWHVQKGLRAALRGEGEM